MISSEINKTLLEQKKSFEDNLNVDIVRPLDGPYRRSRRVGCKTPYRVLAFPDASFPARSLDLSPNKNTRFSIAVSVQLIQLMKWGLK
ncbi:hypothetical protein TNCV_2949221 [Trichonephila clavipes]|nr:hypothetical protein TNCV_2949221 [Trichonephila clavipes]